VIRFKPLETDTIDVSFPKVRHTEAVNALGTKSPNPVGLAELQFSSLSGYEGAPPNASSVFVRLCGAGPQISIDGKTFQTFLWGTYGELAQLQPLHFEVCRSDTNAARTGQGGPFTPLTVALPKGGHHVLGLESSVSRVPFLISGLTVTSNGPTNHVGPARRVSTERWGPENRSVRVGPGAASYLEVHQNFNSGWIATMNGKRLPPIILDGWQQGYLLPAGAGGVVHMTFQPESLYLLGLLVGAGGVVVLCLLVLLSLRRRSRFGRWGGSYEPVDAWSPSISAVVAAILCALVIFIIGGPVALAVPLLLVVGRLQPRLLPWLAATGMICVGLLSAHEVGNGAQSAIGAFGTWAQLAAVLAIAAVLTPVGRSRSEGPQDPENEGQGWVGSDTNGRYRNMTYGAAGVVRRGSHELGSVLPQ
jgi:arabinofuranan 3-O-arabinosyltransferase